MLSTTLSTAIERRSSMTMCDTNERLRYWGTIAGIVVILAIWVITLTAMGVSVWILDSGICQEHWEIGPPGVMFTNAGQLIEFCAACTIVFGIPFAVLATVLTAVCGEED